VQARPQEPQLLLLVRRFTSQPSARLPLQLAKPGLHVAIAHVPLAQAAVALAKAQRLPQAPQWVVALRTLVSQPLPVFMSQLPQPAAQVPPQVPLMHVRITLGKDGQMLPQDPQLFGLVWRLTQAPVAAQKVVPAAQALAQTPPAHTCPMVQRLPQAPQLFEVTRAVSQPSSARPLQLPKPALQAPRPHDPPVQVAAALG
jgi:hypothetical protein